MKPPGRSKNGPATPSKRERLSQLAQRLGALSVLERQPLRRGLLVLTYHRISPTLDDPFDEDNLSATVAGFREQMEHIRRRYRVVGLDDVLDVIEGRARLRGPSILVTFDDGYRDNHDHALPILEELDIPAVFFIATGFIDRPRLTWWDRIAYTIKTARRDRVELEHPRPLTFSCAGADRSALIRAVLGLFKSTPGIDEERFFEHLEERTGARVRPEVLGRDLFMTWDQVRALRQAGMSIGAHTHDHPVLSHLPEAEQRAQMKRSRKVLEREIGEPITSLAYPVGARWAFTEATQRIARELGFRAGFSFHGGINRARRLEPFNILRAPVSPPESQPIFRLVLASYHSAGRPPF